MPDFAETVSSQQVIMEHLLMQVSEIIPAGVKVNVSVDKGPFEDLVMKLKAALLARRLAEDEYILRMSFPLTPWDHWKHNMRASFPFLRRVIRKVNYYTEERRLHVRDFHTFPESTIQYPSELGEAVLVQLVFEERDRRPGKENPVG